MFPDIIGEKLEEAWEEQDISKFNALLDLQKRYADGEDTKLNLFIIAEKQKKLNEMRETIFKIRQRHQMLTPIEIRLYEVEKFLRDQER